MRALRDEETTICERAAQAAFVTTDWRTPPVFTDAFGARALLHPTSEQTAAALTESQFGALRQAGGAREAFVLTRLPGGPRPSVGGDPAVASLEDYAAYVALNGDIGPGGMTDHAIVPADASWAVFVCFDAWGMVAGSEDLVAAVAGDREQRTAAAEAWLEDVYDDALIEHHDTPYDDAWIRPLLHHLLGEHDAASVIARAGAWLTG